MKKYVRDPSINTHQESSSGGRLFSQTDNQPGSAVAQNMADSYAKR